MLKLLTMVLAMHSLSAFAADSSDGCGLANLVYDKKSMVGISTRSTIRGSYSGILDWTGTTSGKFGCAKHSIVKAEKRGLHFLNANIDAVLTDASTGRGEYLQGLARSLGCQDGVFSHFALEVQENFGDIFFPASDDQARALRKIQDIIKSNKTLTNNCLSAV